VSVAGKPGIYFFSVDADSRPAAFAARQTYRLPYFRSEIEVEADGGSSIHYRVRRVSADGPPAEFAAAYGPEGKPNPADPGTLAHFLAERYCLCTLDEQRRICRAEIHHPPWPLQPAGLELDRNTMTAGLGLNLGICPNTCLDGVLAGKQPERGSLLRLTR
jgi:uncharacterized protein